MPVMSDAQLLREYAERGHEPAFRELVGRYADLVYSAALRQTGSADTASEIAQQVFVDLARKAGALASRLGTESSLAGWLHRGTRYAVLTHLRDTRRRLKYERQAMEHLLADSEAGADWERIRPTLDEALDSLADEDREALLLRFFRNQDFRTVGRALGVSDDAAQKRVSRALERLRVFFARRGVTLGVGGLAAALSANAVQAAPAGLAAAISTAAVSLSGTALTTTVATATQTIAMTTLQKTLVTVTLAVLAGVGIYEARQAGQFRTRVRLLEAEQAALVEEVQRLRGEREETARLLGTLREENERLGRDRLELLQLRGQIARLRQSTAGSGAWAGDQPDTDRDAITIAAKSWLSRVEWLKQYATQPTSGTIPEFQLLTEEDWLDVAKDQLETAADHRMAMSKLRAAAERKAGEIIQRALIRFAQENQWDPPIDLVRLRPYLEPPLDEAILQRWEIAPQDRVPNIGMGNDWILTQRAAVDEDYDLRQVFNPLELGHGCTNWKVRPPAER